LPGIRDPRQDPIGAIYDYYDQQRYQAWLADADQRTGGVFSQAYQAIGQGNVPPDIVQRVNNEERQTWFVSQNPEADILHAAQLRGWRSPAQLEAQRRAAAEAQRRADEQRAAVRAKADAKEQEWRDWVTRRVALLGVTLEDVLPNWDDRVRYHRGRRDLQHHSGGW
jgi:hypothetical protein